MHEWSLNCFLNLYRHLVVALSKQEYVILTIFLKSRFKVGVQSDAFVYNTYLKCKSNIRVLV